MEEKNNGLKNMRTVGRRVNASSDLQSADGFLKLVLALRGKKVFLPKGVYRFSSFEESFQWSMRMMTRDLNRGSRL